MFADKIRTTRICLKGKEGKLRVPNRPYTNGAQNEQEHNEYHRHVSRALEQLLQIGTKLDQTVTSLGKNWNLLEQTWNNLDKLSQA